nr:uncharacterized protein LOC121470108 isoform X1 [Taeniopygia guttata]
MTAPEPRYLPEQGQTALARVGRSDSLRWKHRPAGGSREHQEKGRNGTSGSRGFPEVEERCEAFMQDQNSSHLLNTLSQATSLSGTSQIHFSLNNWISGYRSTAPPSGHTKFPGPFLPELDALPDRSMLLHLCLPMQRNGRIYCETRCRHGLTTAKQMADGTAGATTANNSCRGADGAWEMLKRKTSSRRWEKTSKPTWKAG